MTHDQQTVAQAFLTRAAPSWKGYQQTDRAGTKDHIIYRHGQLLRRFARQVGAPLHSTGANHGN